MAHPADANTAFSVQDAGVSISKLKTPSDLTKKLDGLRRGRQMLENQWKLNLAFYKGRQYTYFNRASRRLESLPVEEGEKPRYLVRLVSNQIIVGSHSLLAKFIKTKPVMNATPGSGSDIDIKASQMAQALLEYWWEDLCLDDKLEEALLWSIITGQGWWKTTWDPHAGKEMKFLLDPNGQPIVDDTLKDLFRANLTRSGIQPQEKTVYMGDLKVEVPSPFDTYVDPTAHVFDDAKYVVCIHNLDPDEIFSRWGVWVVPDKVSAAPDATLPFANVADITENTVKQVNIGYFRPSPALPNGRYVVWLDRPSKILEDGPWPYPSHDLPFVKFPGIRIPGQIYDSSVVEHAIPIQKELNRTISQIVQYKNLTVKPRVWAPAGSLPTRLTDEPGAVYEYNPIGDHRPEIEKMPGMQSYVFQHLEEIRNQLKEIFGLTQVSEGQLPPNLEAGVAIDLLQEMSTDRLAPTIKLIEQAIARAGQLLLMLGQKYYIEPRLMNIKGSGGSTQVKRFTQADIAGAITVHVEAGSALPRTRAGRQSRIEWMIDKGIIAPDQAYKYMDIADLKGLAKQWEAAEDMALREHEKISQGALILNDESYNDALKSLEAGQATDPDSGQPISDPTAAENFLHQAGLQPHRYENFEQHLSTHSLWMQSVEFENLPLELREAMVDHYTNTLMFYLKLPKPVQFQSVRPTLQIKTTAGPTTVAEILNKAGILDASPEQLSEPPLDTWVTDDLSKLTQDSSGNTQADAASSAVNTQQGLQQMDQSASQHEMQMGEMADLREAKTHSANAQATERTVKALATFAEAQEKVRAARAKADLAERVAREKQVNTPRPRNNNGQKA